MINKQENNEPDLLTLKIKDVLEMDITDQERELFISKLIESHVEKEKSLHSKENAAFFSEKINKLSKIVITAPNCRAERCENDEITIKFILDQIFILNIFFNNHTIFHNLLPDIEIERVCSQSIFELKSLLSLFEEIEDFKFKRIYFNREIISIEVMKNNAIILSLYSTITNNDEARDILKNLLDHNL